MDWIKAAPTPSHLEFVSEVRLQHLGAPGFHLLLLLLILRPLQAIVLLQLVPTNNRDVC